MSNRLEHNDPASFPPQKTSGEIIFSLADAHEQQRRQGIQREGEARMRIQDLNRRDGGRLGFTLQQEGYFETLGEQLSLAERREAAERRLHGPMDDDASFVKQAEPIQLWTQKMQQFGKRSDITVTARDADPELAVECLARGLTDTHADDLKLSPELQQFLDVRRNRAERALLLQQTAGAILEAIDQKQWNAVRTGLQLITFDAKDPLCVELVKVLETVPPDVDRSGGKLPPEIRERMDISRVWKGKPTFEALRKSVLARVGLPEGHPTVEREIGPAPSPAGQEKA